MPKISALVTYPVKSCAGVSLDAVALTSTGLAFDRVWSVVHAKDGKFISQRTHPRLALVSCAIDPPEAYTDATIRRFTLTCEAKSMDRALRVEVDLDAKSNANALSQTECWDWLGTCANEGETAEKWFSEFLNQDESGSGESYALVRWLGRGGFPGGAQDEDVGVDVDDATTRLTSENYGSRRCTTTLSDGYPMLLVNQSSINALDAMVRPTTRVDGRRFRGNVVVDDAPAYAEDRWASIQISQDIHAELCKPCSRCTIPAVDPDTGSTEHGDAVVRALAQTRGGAALGTSNRFWRACTFFGWNLIVPALRRADQGMKILRVGDVVDVTSHRDGFP